MLEEIRKQIAGAMRLKLIGNEQLKTSAHRAARETYIEALKLVLVAVDLLKQAIQQNENILKEDLKKAHEFDAVKSEIEEVRLQLISNLALTEIKLEMWSEALSHTSMVLVADPANVKALFRRAVARTRLGEQLEEAIADLKKLREQDPKNAEIVSEISNAKNALAERKKRDDEFRTAFRGSLKSTETKDTGIWGLVGWLAQCGGLRHNPGRTTKKSS
jgi:tetratricopeptide (TPR) repeat protein